MNTEYVLGLTYLKTFFFYQKLFQKNLKNKDNLLFHSSDCMDTWEDACIGFEATYKTITT